jgi:4'-phosphopantetheinyl transferase
MEYVAAHGALRLVLSGILDCAPAALGFEVSDTGKPFALLRGVPAPVSFSLSHTDGMVGFACCAAPGVALGFDLETPGRAVSADLAAMVFRPEERAWLGALPEGERDRGFLRLWTLKEAYIKGTGEGLGRDLQSFWFAPGPPPRLNPDPPGEAWWFDSRVLAGGFLAAIALCGTAPAVSWETLEPGALLAAAPA